MNYLNHVTLLPNMLYDSQIQAIDKTISNDFKSGVHCHATGTGKSYIALEIILEYIKKYPSSNILWLCEQKTILKEQFDENTLISKGYSCLKSLFTIFDFNINKKSKWVDELNKYKNTESIDSLHKKPLLLIINRAFLVSKKSYENFNFHFDLIIHDECHSILNKTTQQFYNHTLTKYEHTKCIGFSATPDISFYPYDNIISHYSIYDAYCDNIILPPQIQWISSDMKLNDNDIISICSSYFKTLVYKKIIVWCGMIELCNYLAELWSHYFCEYEIFVDTSKNTTSFEGYDLFSLKDNNSILFCAGKHREGSDIKNLDCCVFLDKVENRNPKTFVQCIGRVLRKDPNNIKKQGLIIDLKATNCLKICDRMNFYLNCKDTFPWIYHFQQLKINSKPYISHTLSLTNNNPIKSTIIESFTILDLQQHFIKSYPFTQEYCDRLSKELSIIDSKNLSSYLMRAVNILKLTSGIPHVTRGSCGSSLVCYLLGISNVDPIKHNIKFERFLNNYRDNLPDVDIDFPHNLRDEVFLKLELKWPNQVARISNHVNWHDKSSLREALRRIGIKQRVPKEDIHKFIKTLPFEQRQEISKIQNELNDTFRHYSLHCGGIIFFHEGIPKELLYKDNIHKTLSQIIYDKNDVSNNKNFKIDILSSRAISQLIEISGKDIDFNDCPYDHKTYQLLQSGDNIGITLAESPLMRKALLKIKPKSITDIAVCLAIIRPAAKDARIGDYNIDFDTTFIFDDDAITILADKLSITLDLADRFRRSISSNNWDDDILEKYNYHINKLDLKTKKDIEKSLSNLRNYSFCKSHSYSYAQLVYKLAYQKAHYPKKFWYATLKHASSSYRKWVHMYHAHISGVDSFSLSLNSDTSIYAENRKKKVMDLSNKELLKRYGYWNFKDISFYPDCYFYKKDEHYLFSGIIANMRVFQHNKTTIASICVSPNKYIEILIKKIPFPQCIGLKGRAICTDKKLNTYKTILNDEGKIFGCFY